jgi:flavin-dependent dehydrogenase
VDRYAARIPGLALETWNTRRVGSDTWALLGDAAGFADPVTGEGIYYALRSAELFAEAYLAGRAADYEELGARTSGANCAAPPRCADASTATFSARLSPTA